MIKFKNFLYTAKKIWERTNDRRKLVYFFATGFGAGLSPFAPGTMGTLVAIPFYLLLYQLPLTFYAILLILSFLVGIWLCAEATKSFAYHDHPAIVWDEMVGFWLTMFVVPFSLFNIVAGFLVFRWVDIQKPWPIKWIDQKVVGGTGIMLDDIIAAIYANLVLRMFIFFTG